MSVVVVNEQVTYRLKFEFQLQPINNESQLIENILQNWNQSTDLCQPISLDGTTGAVVDVSQSRKHILSTSDTLTYVQPIRLIHSPAMASSSGSVYEEAVECFESNYAVTQSFA